MLTEIETVLETETGTELPPELASITETVEYPSAVVNRWLKEAEITMREVAAGKDRSIESLALELGINLDDLDENEDYEA